MEKVTGFQLMIAILPALLLGCAGRDAIGSRPVLPPERIDIEDTFSSDILEDTDLTMDLTDYVPENQGDNFTPDDFTPDIPPIPCNNDDDCGLTGAEPCFVAVCVQQTDAGGICQVASGLQCETATPCVVSLCKPEVGCIEVAGPDGPACDDDNACTMNDQCTTGICIGSPINCQDNNPCTADFCDTDVGICYYLNVPTDCNDGNACTEGDKCNQGTCSPGALIGCNDGNPCTADSCSPQSGCAYTPIPLCCTADIQCSDSNQCTTDICADLTCSHQSVTCNDNHPCTIDGCNPLTGCQFTKIPDCCVSDIDCDDSNVCTTGACLNGTCQYQDLDLCHDNNPCTTDTCNPDMGCVFLPIDNCCLVAGDCNDSDACTTESCNDNLCHYQEISCFDANPCTADSCQPASGCIFPTIPGCCQQDSQCNDSDKCTQDWCGNLTCHNTPITCQDDDICTTDDCTSATGCTYKPIPGCCHQDSDCSDNDPCTDTWCSADNKCAESTISCSDGNACTIDECIANVGCVFTPVNDADCCQHQSDCDDGDLCTTDKCINNKCSHTPVISPQCCTPDCNQKECGPNGCGGYCGYCQDPAYCNNDGQCADICIPDCTGKECGPDGCGTFCGLCPAGQICSAANNCINCNPSCAGKECGPDGCGDSCGFCEAGDSCNDATGKCKSGCDCTGISCSQDGFESGALSGWSLDGDAEVIHNMGVTQAPQGWFMAFVGTGLSELELGKIQKTFCPPPHKKFFAFKWRLYSAEFVEWCGSIYQDRFIVTIANSKQSVVILDLSVDELCPTTSCVGCGDKFIGLEEADVEFDYPDVWVTPWSTAFFELPEGFANDPLTLTFEVSDVGDMVYVTAVLIDAIQFL